MGGYSRTPESGDRPEVRIAVVVPVYNEALGIGATLNSLLMQTDADFQAVFCDNNSTDGTADVIRTFIAQHGLPWRVTIETLKGTGAAADTACREAIAAGATVLARTDADCTPAPNWVAKVREIFSTTNLELVGGLTHPRTDDLNLSTARVLQLKLANELAILFGRFRPANRSREFMGPYRMVSGNNLVITARMYQICGGFPRTAIDDVHEDRALLLAVRRVTPNYALRRDLLVLASARRPIQWGILATLQWYRNHTKPSETVDIR
jgi:glycosyltransferase involved in cell wall biosynthesis